MSTSTGERERTRDLSDPPRTLRVLPSAPRRRMLLIVNPHASTVSPQLRGLVLRALESRFEVEAVDTRAAGRRDHARARGRRRRL